MKRSELERAGKVKVKEKHGLDLSGSRRAQIVGGRLIDRGGGGKWLAVDVFTFKALSVSVANLSFLLTFDLG